MVVCGHEKPVSEILATVTLNGWVVLIYKYIDLYSDK